MAKDDVQTLIKKYANRRLYHTGTSTYVTLEDLAEMVKKGEDFVVTDAKSGEDLTRSVLTQIIFELENRGQNLLPIAFLRQLIRFYGDQMQALVPTYLEFTMTRFADEQTKMREQIVSKALGGDMFGALHDQTRANMQVFQDAFRLFNPFAVTQRGTAEKPAEPETDIDNLKREIEAMRQRLDKMGSR